MSVAETSRLSAKLKVALLLFAAALVVRIYGLSIVDVPTQDEALHVTSAYNYVERGYFGPDMWYHPPLKHILHYGSLRLLGNNLYGWRIPNVIFGAASVPLVYVLGVEALGLSTGALLGAIFLMLDPLHLAFSRLTFEDIPSAFFLPAAAYFVLRARKADEEWPWVWAGISLGLAFSLKWYAAGVALVLVTASFLGEWRRGGWQAVNRPVAWLVVLPLAIYLSSYAPWFQRGHGLADWLALQSDAFREMRNVVVSEAAAGRFLVQLDNPIDWFFRLRSAGFEHGGQGGWRSYVVLMNNPPVWILVLPSVGFMLVSGFRAGRVAPVVVACSFLSLYLPLFFIRRAIFLYSSLPELPFAFLGIGYAADRVPRAWLRPAALCLVLWCLYLYPLSMGIPVPVIWYEPLVRMLNITRMVP